MKNFKWWNLKEFNRRVAGGAKVLFKMIGMFLRTWNELLTIPLGLVIWYYSPYLLLKVDPTSAFFDAGIFQLILFAIIGSLVLGGFNWLLIKINFPGLYRYIDNNFEEDLCKVAIQYRVGYALLFYFLHFLMLVLLVRAI